ncbi:MAG: hypothetical protein HZA90_13395 [Verrucomicrobia bacterium]|nr:hypothetical protein [Verrucomicrobiota bacterium]
MIPLPHDSLVFKLAGGDTIPCTTDAVNFQIAGDGAGLVDAELLRNAAAAVLHFFHKEHHRTSVSVEEFSSALEKVLHGFGLTFVTAGSPLTIEAPRIAEADLCSLVMEGMELLFFHRLREELRRQLGPAPGIVRFRGLRDCVKHLAGAKRWSPRCQTLSDQIVDYLRGSLSSERVLKPCGLVVV